MFSITTLNKKLHSRPLSLTKDERGLTTVEYVILLVLIAVGSIGLWRTFGESVAGKITSSTGEINGLASATPTDGKPGG